MGGGSNKVGGLQFFFFNTVGRGVKYAFLGFSQ